MKDHEKRFRSKALYLSTAGINDRHIWRGWKPDVMNAAWGGISDDKEISICVSENHKTTENILKKGAFTVSMADVSI